MADVHTKEVRSKNMGAIRNRDTQPELKVRRLLHGLGFRFRLHRRDLPGTPDLVLQKYRTVIYVHGCFFHGHDCHLFKLPVTRRVFWSEKIYANVVRDHKSVSRIRELGWRVIIVWECALKGKHKLDLQELAGALNQFLHGKLDYREISGIED